MESQPMENVKYIGSFPPPFGGVTVKNNLIYYELSKSISINRNTMQSKIIKQLKDIIDILFCNKPLIIGVSASRGKSGFITRLLYTFNRKIMRKSIYFMMGGLEAGIIATDEKKIEQYKNYARVYVETNSMKCILEAVGLKNVSLFPNCRKRPEVEIPVKKNDNGVLKCVFFSNIQLLKGVDLLLDVAKQMPDVEFYFYGSIDKEIEIRFNLKINAIKNAFYKGVFDGMTKDPCTQLSEYDVLLFPTRWKNEGVPGVLVEGKIAGLAEIVTDICYNRELVDDGVDGIVIDVDSADALKDAISELNKDRQKLFEYKTNSRISAEKFYIDNYVPDILSIYYDLACPSNQ